MNKLPAVLVNYKYTPYWLKDYPELDVILYDRSDDGVQRDLMQYGKLYRTQNLGNVDFDKLSYIVDNYHNLPDVFLWAKSNIFKYVDEPTFKEALKKKEFTPLLKQDHPTYSDNTMPDGSWNIVSTYQDGMYCERKGIVNTLHHVLPYKFCISWEEWTKHFGIKDLGLIPFPPGGNFILTKERVHRYGVDLYRDMLSTLPHSATPVEAQLAERSYYLMWK